MKRRCEPPARSRPDQPVKDVAVRKGGAVAEGGQAVGRRGPAWPSREYAWPKASSSSRPAGLPAAAARTTVQHVDSEVGMVIARPRRKIPEVLGALVGGMAIALIAATNLTIGGRWGRALPARATRNTLAVARLTACPHLIAGQENCLDRQPGRC